MPLTNNPTKDDNQGQDQQRNLHTRSHRHADCEIHLILAGNGDGGSMLGRVTNNRQENQTNKGFANVSGFCQGVDRVDLVQFSSDIVHLGCRVQAVGYTTTHHELGTDGNQCSGEQQRQKSHEDGQLRLLGLVTRVLHLHLRVLAAHGADGHFADLGDSARCVALGDALAAFLHLGTWPIVDLRVGLELEEEVAAVDDEKENASSY